MKLKLVVPFVLLLTLLTISTTSAATSVGAEIDASNILKGGPYYVLSAHGVPNGMPCEWYAYATTVGLPYCAHPGIDISANYENLYAATDGVIEFAGSDTAYWPMHVDIRVSSGPYVGELHLYGHMSQVWVEPGQSVKKGDQIGVSGEAGGAPHIHFERRTAPTAKCPAGCANDPEPPLHGGQSAETEANAEQKQSTQSEETSDSDERQAEKPDMRSDSDQTAVQNQSSTDNKANSDNNSKSDKKSKKKD